MRVNKCKSGRNPLLQLSLGPHPLSFISTVGVDHSTLAVLNTVLPQTTVLAAIRVSVHAKPILFILGVGSLVPPPILPSVNAAPMHHATLELTLVVAAI